MKFFYMKHFYMKVLIEGANISKHKGSPEPSTATVCPLGPAGSQLELKLLSVHPEARGEDSRQTLHSNIQERTPGSCWSLQSSRSNKNSRVEDFLTGRTVDCDWFMCLLPSVHQSICLKAVK